MGRHAWSLVIILALGCTGEPAYRSPAPLTPTPSTTPTPGLRGQLARAVALVRTGEDARARPLLADLLAADPVLEDYYLNLLAVVDQRGGRANAAAGFDERLMTRHPESVWAPHVLARQAARAEANGARDARVLVERSLAHPDADAESRALALLIRGNLQTDTRPHQAYRVFHEVRRLGGNAAQQARARAQALEAAHPALLTNVELQLAEVAVRAAEGRDDLAAERLEELANVAPAHERGRVLRELARTLKLAERYDDAIAVLRRAVALDPSLDNPAHLQLAFLLWSQDHDAEARVMFERLLQASPHHPARTFMRYAIGRIAEERGDLDEALRRYREVARGGNRKLARESRWRLGWAPYRAGDLETANAGFSAIARRGAADRTAALYWQGRVRARSGDLAAAVPLYETVLTRSPQGYYGGLAEERLGRPPTRATQPAPIALGSAPAQDYHWRRRTALLQAGLEPLAAREVVAWARTLSTSERRAAAMVEVYASVGAYARARRLAHRLARRGTITGGTLLGYDYPRAHWRHVVRIAKELALDPYLLLAIMRQESLFDTEAISPLGARGLMQLMPRTARRVYGNAVDLRTLADPATNIEVGARYLRQLLDRYDGRVAWAAAAYNAGEHAVDKWVAREGEVEPDEFVESISYRETRTYVKAVLANIRRYRQLYGGIARVSRASAP